MKKNKSKFYEKNGKLNNYVYKGYVPSVKRYEFDLSQPRERFINDLCWVFHKHHIKNFSVCKLDGDNFMNSVVIYVTIGDKRDVITVQDIFNRTK